jgi:response regulator RpfG family c-di-GMP phosphodiesterase/DNA-directed RNA polymerase subunit RPC12/RpoP
MDLTCKKCGSTFRAAVTMPLVTAVRVACPRCEYQMVLKPRTSSGRIPLPEGLSDTEPPPVAPTRIPRRRLAAIADEPRPFRAFLGDHLRRLGFDVSYFETGDTTLDFARRMRADLVIVNVYLKGMLGVEVTEEIKADPALKHTHVILIGALFRANRFRANPTNLYGADEYIEEQIPEKEFRQIIHKLFPQVGEAADDVALEPREYDEARRLARLILSDIIIYHVDKVEQGIRDGNFFEILREEIDEGRHYYDSRVPMSVRRDTEIYTETLQQFVQMKRDELARLKTGTQ